MRVYHQVLGFRRHSMAYTQTPGYRYFIQADFCGPPQVVDVPNVCSCPGWVPADCIRVSHSEYKISGTATTVTNAIQKSRAARLVLLDTNAEAVVIAAVDAKYTETHTAGIMFNNRTAGLRLDTVECNMEEEGWTVVASGMNPTGWGWPLISDGYSVNSSYTRAANDSLVFVGKCGVAGTVPYAQSKSGDVQSDAYIQTIPSYFTTFRTLLDPSWALGIRFMQGVGKETHATIICNEEEDAAYGITGPTVEAWRDVRVTHNGWPTDTTEDKRTSPIGFA